MNLPTERELVLLQAVLQAGGCLDQPTDFDAAEVCVGNAWLILDESGSYALTLAGADALRPSQSEEITIWSLLKARDEHG